MPNLCYLGDRVRATVSEEGAMPRPGRRHAFWTAFERRRRNMALKFGSEGDPELALMVS